MQIFGVLLYYPPRGHIEMKYKSFFLFEILNVASEKYYDSTSLVYQFLKDFRIYYGWLFKFDFNRNIDKDSIIQK